MWILLNGMLGMFELLNDIDLISCQCYFIWIMEILGWLLLYYVNDVLDIVWLDLGQQLNKFEVFVFDELVQQVIEIQCVMVYVNLIQIEIDISMLWNLMVLGDLQVLCQVLLNFVSNVIKFICDGVVWIEVEMIGFGDLIEFCVSDIGLGIVENDMDWIFDDFVIVDSLFLCEFGGIGFGFGIVW